MRNYQGFGLEIVVNGHPLGEHQFNGRTYVAAPLNTEYQLRLLVPSIRGNRHPYKRFLAVCSVDGLDIMTGKRAIASESRGYIMTPASHLTDNDIPGYRINDREVAAFRFGDRSDAYATQMDQPENVGTIGVIFFSEYDPEPTGLRRGGHDMGTEFGARTSHEVTRDHFQKERELFRFTLEYASVHSLLNAGIIGSGIAKLFIASSPLGEVSAFDEGSGCQPPRDWRG